MLALSSANPTQAPVTRFSAETCCLSINQFHLAYAGKTALRDLTLDVPRHRVTAFIGPSGCGKSTLLRAIYRLHDLNESVTHHGQIQLEDQDIHAPQMNVTELRRRVGMVFQTPNPYSTSSPCCKKAV